MSINTHVRYTLSCDECSSFYFNGEKYADAKMLVFSARRDGWNIYDTGSSYVCICPDCKRKGEVQNEA